MSRWRNAQRCRRDSLGERIPQPLKRPESRVSTVQFAAGFDPRQQIEGAQRREACARGTAAKFAECSARNSLRAASRECTSACGAILKCQVENRQRNLDGEAARAMSVRL